MGNKLEMFRMGYESMEKSYEKADNVSINKGKIGNVDCYWFKT